MRLNRSFRASRSVLGLLVLAGCFWKAAPGPVPLDLAEGPAVVLSRIAPKGAHLEVAVRAGSASDPVGQEGLAWLVARGIAEGGTVARSPEEVEALLKQWEGVLAVSVDPEIARFTLDISPEHTVEAAALLGEMLTTPRLDPAVLSRLSGQALARSRDGLPAEGVPLASQLLVNVLFAGHPYGHAAVGRWGIATTLKPVDARRFFEQRYVRSALVGGVTAAAPTEPLARLQAALGASPPALSRDVVPRPVPTIQGRRVLVVRGPPSGAWIAVGMQPSLANPDGPALAVAAEVLRARLATRSGAPLWVEVAPFPQATQQSLSVTAQGSGPDQGPAALKMIVEAIELLALQGVSADEVERARDALLSARSSALGDPDLALASALRAAALGGTDPLETLPARLAGLSAPGVNAALARQLQPQNLRVVAVVPDVDSFQRALREDSTAPFVQGTTAAAGQPQGESPPGGYVLGIDRVDLSAAQDLLR